MTTRRSLAKWAEAAHSGVRRGWHMGTVTGSVKDFFKNRGGPQLEGDIRRVLA